MVRKITAAIAAAGVALAVTADPAAATQNETTPVHANGKKSCKAWAGGGSFWLPHGTTITVDAVDDNGHKYKETIRCTDGSWWTVSVSKALKAGLSYTVAAAFVDESGTAVLVNPRRVRQTRAPILQATGS
jgi:hypothetical protein